MGRVTATIDDDVLEDVDERAEQEHGGNRSAALQELVERGLEYDDLQDDLDHERARLEDLRRQLQEVRSREDDVDELVRYVETERSLQERRARAGLVTRAKWFLTGMEDDVDDDRRRDENQG